jgi:hypothetical protein
MQRKLLEVRSFPDWKGPVVSGGTVLTVNHGFGIAITACAFLIASVGYAQSAINSQDASAKPRRQGEQSATDRLPDSADNGRQAAPGGPQLAPLHRATPANPDAANQNWNLTPPDAEFQTGIPQWVLFGFLFNNIAALNEIAESDEKAGKHISAAAWRTHDQRAAGLNDAEGEILQEVTQDCVRNLKEKDAQIKASADKARTDLDPAKPVPPPPELVQLVAERRAIVKDHIEKLREALGDSSFKKLDTYVHAMFHMQETQDTTSPR